MTVVKNTYQDQRVSEQKIQIIILTLKWGPWLGSWGRDGLGRGGCCAPSLAQAGIRRICRIPIPIVHIRFSYMMKVYGVTNTEIYEEPHYTVICDQRQVIM